MEIARTEDQRAYQQALRRFCEREVAPHAVVVDRGEKSGRFPITVKKDTV